VSSQPLPLPGLDYAYDALEPFFDELTMRTHHLKHHQSYTDKMNEALATLRSDSSTKHLAKLGIDTLLRNASGELNSINSPGLRETLLNHGGGYVNHAFFFKCLAPRPNPESLPQVPQGELSSALTARFGTYADFKTKFSQAATSVFGSGWAWLCVSASQNHTLHIVTTPNQRTARTLGLEPILALDVWEHAYYLKYQNRRADYVDAFWQVVNWRFAELQYIRALPPVSMKSDL